VSVCVIPSTQAPIAVSSPPRAPPSTHWLARPPSDSLPLIHTSIHLLTHSLTYSLTHLLTYSLTHLLIYSFTQLLTYPLTPLLIYSLTRTRWDEADWGFLIMSLRDVMRWIVIDWCVGEGGGGWEWMECSGIWRIGFGWGGVGA
jgi:hypothetical protein